MLTSVETRHGLCNTDWVGRFGSGQKPVRDGDVCVWTGKVEEACRAWGGLAGVPGGERRCASAG